MRFDFSKMFRKVIIFAGSIISVFVMTGIIIAIPFTKDEASKKDDLIEKTLVLNSKSDLEAKNNLLNSPLTDYTEPENEGPVLKFESYVLKSGETLAEVARKFGVSIDSICGCSGITSLDMVAPGQKLKIPNKDGIVFTIKKGQKLIDISNKYKITVEKILRQNHSVNPDFLVAGTQIFIPDAKPQNMEPAFLWPVAHRYVTSQYGMRVHPITGEYMMHNGLDVRANYEWVRSTKYGCVTYTGWLGGYGNAVVVSHPGGYKSLYGHLSKIIVQTGQYVKQGQIIAKSGNTGDSTGPHLHFEIQKNGAFVNPKKFIK